MCQWSIENKSISAAQLKDEREKLVSLSFKLAFYFAVEAFQFWCLISSLARISSAHLAQFLRRMGWIGSAI
jgi:hypothetical protein